MELKFASLLVILSVLCGIYWLPSDWLKIFERHYESDPNRYIYIYIYIYIIYNNYYISYNFMFIFRIHWIYNKTNEQHMMKHVRFCVL